MLFTGVNGANDGVYYVNPYTGVINLGSAKAQPVVLFCDDINNEVYVGEIWQANATDMATGNLSNTRYGNGLVNPNLGGTTSPQTLCSLDRISIRVTLRRLCQFAIRPVGSNDAERRAHKLRQRRWDPGNSMVVLGWADYAQINPANFSIVTNVGPLSYKGQVQEFIVSTPEPAGLVLMLVGMGFMCLLLGRRRQPSA